MITLQNVTIRRGPHVLLKDVNWTIFHKQHIGIIGANGSGKTTLFALLQNELQADKGNVEIPRQLKLAHVAQETPAYAKSALDFVMDGDTELRALQEELLEAEEQDDGERIASLHGHLSAIDSYTAPARAARLLDGLGFSLEEQQKPVSDFSGGWRMRLNLAKALMCRSDILLLDEPTNHLDLDAVIWLEQWLLKYPGTLLLISHDRDFFDNVVDHIAHLSHQHLKVYSGNYTSFEKQRAAQLLLQQAAYEKQQKQIAHLQSFVDRFKAKASKARQAQSRVKAIARMELVSVVQVESNFEFAFKEPAKCPYPLIHLDGAGVAYGDKRVLRDVNLSIAPKDRIGLLGLNGAGKSSLIKLLAGEIPPAEGERVTSEGLKIGYFAQHQVDSLDLDASPLEIFKKIAPNAAESELRGFLGGFCFIGNRVFETAKNFSGGEKSRLALALIVWQRPNLLLLDEPTNHLDLDMRQALSMALQEYQGAVVLVSHDRFLLSTTMDQFLLVSEQKVKNFDGDLTDYQNWLFDFRRKAEKGEVAQEEKSSISRKEQRQLDAKMRELRRPFLQKIKQLEEKLKKLEKKAADLELVLASEELYEEQNKLQLEKHLAEQTKLNKEMKQVETEWLEVTAELESLDKKTF